MITQNEIYCPIRPLPHVSGAFWKRAFFPPFPKKCESTRGVFAVVFARPHENAETMEISIESLTEHANLRFCLSIRKRKAAGFKKYPFWSAFLVIVFTGSCAQIPTASSQYCRDIWLELKLCWLPPLAVNIILFILKCWESLCRHGLNILSTGFLWMLAEYCDCLIVSFSSWDCLVPERIVRC